MLTQGRRETSLHNLNLTVWRRLVCKQPLKERYDKFDVCKIAFDFVSAR
jgi:hypothetical protein